MENKLEMLKRDALYAYLELCNAIKEVPRKKTYDALNNHTDPDKIEEAIQIIEKVLTDFEKGKL